jgi:hypothetical protein
MTPSKRKKIASKGGRAAHKKGTAHEFDKKSASAAGRKGGLTISQNREHMAAIGRKGAATRNAQRRAQRDSRINSELSMSSDERKPGDIEA